MFKPTLVQGWGHLHAQSLSAGHTNYKCTNNFGSFTLKMGGKLSSSVSLGVGMGCIELQGPGCLCSPRHSFTGTASSEPLGGQCSSRSKRWFQTLPNWRGVSPAAHYISHGARQRGCPLSLESPGKPNFVQILPSHQ